MPSRRAQVIVGGGLAGAKAAEALRAEGWDGPVVLLAAEPAAPYERPPLSKELLRGEATPADARVHPEGWYREQGIDLRLGTAARSLDPAVREVVLADGRRLVYESVLLAPGAEPRRLGIPGAELDGVHYLRDLRDAARLAAALRRARRIAVVGAGWIGAEVAASARQMGLDVALIEQAPVPLERVLGPEVGCFYANLHRDQGVALHTAASVERFEGEGAVAAVRLGSGRSIPCDLVVVGIGVLPRTRLAEDAGLAVDDGIVVNARLETSAPGVFAAGDAADAFHPFYGRPLRVEHWANALRQSEVAARAMLGKPAAYDALPYFFSDQYDVGMEYSGYAPDWDEVVFRGDPLDGEFIAFWLRDGRVLAGMNVNVWDVADAIQEIVRSRRRVDTRRLRDPDVPLDAVLEYAHR